MTAADALVYPGLLVTADDRSGAMEAAALCADAGWIPDVCSWDGEPPSASADCWVVDLRSRHVSSAEASERARRTAGWDAEHRVHKIDSTLRGNWVAELEALRAGRRVLLIPSYPAAGRTCERGIVRVHGVPVAESEFAHDERTPVRSSRPAEALGAVEVVGVDALGRWLGSGDGPSCVADAATDAEIDALVSVATENRDVLIAGPAGVIGSMGRRCASGGHSSTPPALPLGDVLVVSGSRHPASLRQADLVNGRPGVTVLRPPGSLKADADVVALELAVRAHEHVSAHDTELVVLLGGDTADAFIGERVVRVLGSVGTGMAFGVMAVGGREITVIAKPGAFGHDRTVLDLLESGRNR